MSVTPERVLYQVVPPGQGTGPNSFRILSGAATLPIKLLEMAFPDGPDTVPQQETTQELNLGDERIGIVRYMPLMARSVLRSANAASS